MRPVHLLTLILVLLSLSCDGGTTAPGPGPDPGPDPVPLVPPTVTAVTPAGGLGDSGVFVTFAAEAGPCPCTYAWNFESGIAPATSAEAAPVVRLREPGSHTGRVVATNTDGASQAFAFTYAIAVAPNTPSVSQATPQAMGSGVSEGYPGWFMALTVGEVAHYHWDFGEGARPRFATGETPLVNFGGFGTHEGSLRVEGPAGQLSEAFRFPFEVAAATAQPYIFNLGLMGTRGRPGSTLTPFIYSTNIGRLEWDFAGGAFPRFATGTPTVTLGEPGLYQGSVIVSNAHGTKTLYFEYLVENDGPPAPSWTRHELGARSGSMMVLGPNLGLVQFNSNLDQVEFHGAPLPLFGQPIQWATHAIDDFGEGYGATAAGSRAMVCYRNRVNSKIRIAIAAVDPPMSPDDWHQYVLSDRSTYYVALGFSQGRPSVMLGSNYDDAGMELLTGTSAVPTNGFEWERRTLSGWLQEWYTVGFSPDTPLVTILTSGYYDPEYYPPQTRLGRINFDGSTFSLGAVAEYNGTLSSPVALGEGFCFAGIEDGDLKLFRADSLTPSPQDVRSTMIDPLITAALTPAVLIDHGAATIAYSFDGPERVYEVRVARALNANPTGPSDWRVAVIERIEQGGGTPVQLDVIDDRLVLKYANRSDWVIAIADAPWE